MDFSTILNQVDAISDDRKIQLIQAYNNNTLTDSEIKELVDHLEAFIVDMAELQQIAKELRENHAKI